MRVPGIRNKKLPGATVLALMIVFGMAAFPGCSSGEGEANTFYVSVKGDDTQTGSKRKPLATLSGARDKIRELRSEGASGNFTVYLREGYHLQKKTFTLGLEDGTDGSSTITYAGYPGEEAVIGSGLRLNNWVRVQDSLEYLPEVARGKIWVSDIPSGYGWFATLYKGDKRLSCATSEGTLAVPPFSRSTDKSRPNADWILEYPEGLIRAWPNINDVEIVIVPNYPWTMNILKLDHVNEEAKVCKTQLRASYPMRQVQPNRAIEPNLWVQNAIDYLDQPGEWVVNTLERKIYYWPQEGDSPGKDIRVPLLRELIHVGGETDVKGPVDKPVKGIVFKDLTLMHADRDLWTTADRGIQHDWLMEDKPDALLRFRGAEDCRVENCKFTNSGGNALRFDFHCQRMIVTGNEISHLGQGGINFIGYGPGTKDVNKNNTITNNHIHHIGELYWHSHAIVLWQSGGNYLANNFIHDVPRKAFCLAGVRINIMTEAYNKRSMTEKSPREYWKTIRWHEVGPYPETMDDVIPFRHCRNNVIEYNEIRNATNMLGDGATINVSGAGQGNVIRNNLIYDIDNVNACSVLRTDADQDGTVYENNIIYRCHLRAICMNGENIYRNNLFVDVGSSDRKHRYVFSIHTGWAPFRKARSEKNVYVVSNPVNGFYKPGFLHDTTELKEAYIDENLYFFPNESTVFPDMEEMAAEGLDQHSVFADPMLSDPTNWDFSFLPGSPALSLGITPVSLEKVGLRADFPARFNADPGYRGEMLNK